MKKKLLITNLVFCFLAIILSIILLIPGIITINNPCPFEKKDTYCPLCESIQVESFNNQLSLLDYLNKCKTRIIHWTDNTPPSTYKYLDKYLKHYDIFREFRLSKLTNNENEDIQSIAFDISELLKTIYLRGEPPPTVNLSIQNASISLGNISDNKIRNIIRAINIDEFYEPFINMEKHYDKESINEIETKINLAYDWLQKDISNSFLFSNSIVHGIVAKFYLLYSDPNIPKSTRKSHLYRLICKADSILFNSWSCDSLKKYEADENSSTSFRIKCFKESTRIDIFKIIKNNLGQKLKAYINNRIELVTWKRLLEYQLNIIPRSNSPHIKRELSDNQIDNFDEIIEDLALADIDMINSYITIAEYFGIKYYCNPNDHISERECKKFLSKAADLLNKKNMDYFEKETVIKYCEKSLLLCKYYNCKPNYNFRAIVQK